MLQVTNGDAQPWLHAPRHIERAVADLDLGSNGSLETKLQFSPTVENAAARAIEFRKQKNVVMPLVLVTTTPWKIITGNYEVDDKCVKIALITGDIPDGDNFVFPVSQQWILSTADPRFGDMHPPGHVLLCIVHKNEVTLWNPTGELMYNKITKAVCDALNTVRPVFSVGSTDHPIYTFGPQSKLSDDNKLCQSLVTLKLRDLVVNGFPGKIEEYDYTDVDTFAATHLQFSAIPNKLKKFRKYTRKSHGEYAGTSINLWFPDEIKKITEIPNKQFELLGPGQASAIAVDGVVELTYRISESQFMGDWVDSIIQDWDNVAPVIREIMLDDTDEYTTESIFYDIAQYEEEHDIIPGRAHHTVAVEASDKPNKYMAVCTLPPTPNPIAKYSRKSQEDATQKAEKLSVKSYSRFFDEDATGWDAVEVMFRPRHLAAVNAEKHSVVGITDGASEDVVRDEIDSAGMGSDLRRAFVDVSS